MGWGTFYLRNFTSLYPLAMHALSTIVSNYTLNVTTDAASVCDWWNLLTMETMIEEFDEVLYLLHTALFANEFIDDCIPGMGAKL